MIKRLEVIILSLLTTREHSGYEIVKWLERNATFMGYGARPSQVYRQLARMDDAGWVTRTTEDGPEAKPYQITALGVEKLDEWVDSPYVPSERPLDPDFQVRLMFSARRGPQKSLELVRTELAFRHQQDPFGAVPEVLLMPPDAGPALSDWLNESALLQRERGRYLRATLIVWLEATERRLAGIVQRANSEAPRSTDA